MDTLGYSWIFLKLLTRILDFLGFSSNFLKPQLSFFLRFKSILKVFFLDFLARSCKILAILETLGKNLGKNLGKSFRKIQESWQEFQEFFHWVVIMKIGIEKTRHKLSNYKIGVKVLFKILFMEKHTIKISNRKIFW